MRAKNPEQNAHSSLELTNPPAYNNNWSLGYTYDLNGNVQTRTDSRPVTTTYTYDNINRNIKVDYGDATPDVERHYDGAVLGKGRFHFNYSGGNFTTGLNVEHTSIDSYDAVGRALTGRQVFKTNGVWSQDFSSQREYDLAGHITSQTYPSGRKVDYSYGSGGQLSSAGGNLGGTSYTYADTIAYNAAGQMTKERFGTDTSLYHNLHYNNRFQLVDIRLGDDSADEYTNNRGTLVFYYGTNARNQDNPFANSPDNNGNVLRQIHFAPLADGGTVIPQLDDYTYDSLNRISSMTEAQKNSSGQLTLNVTSQTFNYDRWGNRLSVAGYNAQSWDATEASTTNRLKLPSGNTCSSTKNGVCYDAAGNLIFDNTLGSSGDRTYDAENRMTTAAGGGANSYVYNADGKRTRRVVGALVFWQVYGLGGELVAEYEWNGSSAVLQKENGYRDGEMLIVAEGATVRWLVTDHLGTPRILVDQTGSLAGITRHDYFPFGEENSLGAERMGNGYQADNVRQKFTGYEHDGETDLDFAEARYCSTKQGRFTSSDPLLASANPVEPQSWNRYSYVGNRPLLYTDPSGLKWFYNKETNRYGWCNCNELNQKEKDEGWIEIAGMSGAFIYESAGGSLILLPANSPHWRNLTAEFLEQARLRRIDEAKENAEKWANAILLDFITTSVGYGLSLATGGTAGVAKEFVIDQAFDYAERRLASIAPEMDEAAVAPYQVGTYSVLKALSEPNDGLVIHHVPQGHAAAQVIPGYSYANGPAIVLPRAEHLQIPNVKGEFTGTAQELVRRDIGNLKAHTNAPASAIKELRKLIRKIF